MEILGGKTRPQNHRRRDSAFFVLSFSYYLFSYQAYSLAPTQCLKFKTHPSIFLGRFEALNRSLIQKMTNSPLNQTPPALSAPPLVSHYGLARYSGFKSIRNSSPGAGIFGERREEEEREAEIVI